MTMKSQKMMTISVEKPIKFCEEETVKISRETIGDWKSDYNDVDNMLYMLRQDGALFLSTGIKEFMIFRDQCFSLALDGLSDLRDFLVQNNRAFESDTFVFWGMFLDTVKANKVIFLPGFLWELGAKADYRTLIAELPVCTDGGRAIVHQLAKKYGDKLSKNG